MIKNRQLNNELNKISRKMLDFNKFTLEYKYRSGKQYDWSINKLIDLGNKYGSPVTNVLNSHRLMTKKDLKEKALPLLVKAIKNNEYKHYENLSSTFYNIMDKRREGTYFAPEFIYTRIEDNSYDHMFPEMLNTIIIEIKDLNKK